MIIRQVIAGLAATLLALAPIVASAQSISTPGGNTFPLSGSCGTVSVSTPCLNLTQTWNNAGSIFSAATINVTNTASTTNGSRILSLQSSGTEVAGFDIFGDLILSTVNAGFKVGNFADINFSNGNVFGLSSGALLSWSSTTSANGTKDLVLTRDAANTLALRNGVNAQTFRAYNTFTDSLNGEWGSLDWTTFANILTLSTAKNGAGAAHGIRVMAATGSTVQLGNADNNAQTLVIGSTSMTVGGNVNFGTDNTNDIGASGANRPRSIFAGTSIQVGGYFSTGAPTTSSATSYSILSSDSSVILTAATTVTLTLPAPSSFVGRILRLKTTGGGSVISATSNVVPKAGGAAGTAILAATAGTWAELQSDGTNWIIMEGN